MCDPESGYSTLMAAARSYNTTLMAFFMDNGVDINQQDQRGNTALMHAISNYVFVFHNTVEPQYSAHNWEI